MKNNVVVFDLDGTLLDSQNKIIGGIETLKCLNNLQQKGCTLAICTGRLDHDIIHISQEYDLNIDHHISQNGAVYLKNGNLHAHLLNKQEALDIYRHILDKDVRIELNTVSNRYWKTDRDPDFPKELYDSHIIEQDFEKVITYQPAVLFLIVGEADVLNEIATYVHTHYHDTKAVMTSQTSLEIMNINASKGAAMKSLYPESTIYSIGDSPNDFDMFPESKKGYLVSDKECHLTCEKKDSILEALQDIIQCIEEDEK